MGQGGNTREGLAMCPGVGSGGGGGGKPQHWGSHGPLPAPQLLFILNSWHIMGIQVLGALQQDMEIPGCPSSRASVQQGSQYLLYRVGMGRAVGTHVKVLQGNIQIENCSCGGTRGYIRQKVCGMVPLIPL